MCGIFVSCNHQDHCHPSNTLLESLQSRGPDSARKVLRTATPGLSELQDYESNRKTTTFYLTIVSTVLSLRGDSLVSQPLEDSSTGSLLCWNGEAWKTTRGVVQGNDAEVVFGLFLDAIRSYNDEGIHDSSPGRDSLQSLMEAISSIVGPYAFVFYDAPSQRLFYGRDALGRRSLMVTKDHPGGFILSSVSDQSDPETWKEVDADGIYMVDLRTNLKFPPTNIDTISHISWVKHGSNYDTSHHLMYPFPPLNKKIGNAHTPAILIDNPAVARLLQLLRDSILLRTSDIPAPLSEAATPNRVAVLFSGGLDCTVLARLIHDLVPKEQDIDLLNVAFENPRVIQAAAPASLQTPSGALSPYALCPDRITGLASYAELLSICPGRNWRFVSVDVMYAELQAHRSQIISLIRPHNMEMDFSIACALYFAARGSGTVSDLDGGSGTAYTTPARVLFSGLGADELFGGYTRHAKAFAFSGYQGLVDELELDFNRLGKRNLGRDDRVISHWGKEVRYPYLDEDLIAWALSIPVWEKCGFRQVIVPDSGNEPVLGPGKKLLRLVAWQLRLRSAAAENKRAIQFGARTAKMEAGKKKGTQLIS